MTDEPAKLEHPRGDDWTPPVCPGCQEHLTHIAELEDALAAARAAMAIMRSERDTILQVLIMTGKAVVV